MKNLFPLTGTDKAFKFNNLDDFRSKVKNGGLCEAKAVYAKFNNIC